jgi:hypothetical protein
VVQKGTGHLTFKKPDRRDALKAIVAKHFPNARRDRAELIHSGFRLSEETGVFLCAAPHAAGPRR